MPKNSNIIYAARFFFQNDQRWLIINFCGVVQCSRPILAKSRGGLRAGEMDTTLVTPLDNTSSRHQSVSLLILDVFKWLGRLRLCLFVGFWSASRDMLDDLLLLGRPSVLEHYDAANGDVLQWNVPRPGRHRHHTQLFTSRHTNHITQYKLPCRTATRVFKYWYIELYCCQ